MALDLNNPWGRLIDGEYRRFYDRGVTEAELWPIVTLMQQGVRLADGTVRGLTTAEVDALIIAQSGPPLKQSPGPIIIRQPPAGAQPPAGQQPPGDTAPGGGVVCTQVVLTCRPWEKLDTVNGCPACVLNQTLVIAGAGAALGLVVLMRRR